MVRGEDRYVKFHFRGERKFDWNGYQVDISVPYRDHMQMAEFDVAAIDEEFLEKGHAHLTTKELGQRMRQWATADTGKNT